MRVENRPPLRVHWCLFVVFLFALAVLPYLPGLHHAFVYDDHGAIVENRFLADPANLRRVLNLDTLRDPRVLDGQRPVLLLTMFMDRAGSREPQPWRHHATNMALHACSVLLLFQLVRRLAGGTRAGDGLAAATALVLALHPAWSEAVQVPSYREDVLGLMFVLNYLCADFIVRPSLRWPLQLASLALALGSKETAWAAPLLLGWMRFCVPAPGCRSWPTVLAGGGVVAAYVLYGYVDRPMQAAGISWNGLSLHWPENVWTAPWIWWRYVGHVLFPVLQLADHVVTPVPHAWAPRFIGNLVPLLVATVLAWRVRRTQPLVTFAFGWLLLAFAPVSNLVPLLNPMADRYLYGMAPGFALLLALWFLFRPRRRWFFAVLCVGWLLLLHLRLGAWQNDATLWTATARSEPRSARAQTWLGVLAKANGDRVEAQARFTQAETLNPQDVSALINLAILEGQAGDLVSAEKHLREAVRRRPEKSEAWSNLAVALELQGKRDEALQAAEKAKTLDLLGPGR